MRDMSNLYKVYKVENIENDYVYIGTTKNSINERMYDHERKALNGSGHKFQNAIKTMGLESFSWTQIDTASSADELAQLEKKYILEYDSKENGYNADSGGGIKKSVYQYDIVDGSLVGVYDCLKDAGKMVNSTKQNISAACLNVNNIHKEYYWSYEYKEPFISTKDNRRKEIEQIDLEGNVIASYISVAEASRQTGFSKTCISRVCRGEREKTHGYVFRYK